MQRFHRTPSSFFTGVKNGRGGGEQRAPGKEGAFCTVDMLTASEPNNVSRVSSSRIPCSLGSLSALLFYIVCSQSRAQ